MAEPRFSSVSELDVDDDLPRTLRRERDAQARRAREHEFAEPDGSALPPGIAPDNNSAQYPQQNYDYDEFDPPPATVTRLDVPFLHMMLFFLKAVVAAVPALILLIAILWGLGEILTATFPELIKMQVLIRMPN